MFYIFLSLILITAVSAGVICSVKRQKEKNDFLKTLKASEAEFSTLSIEELQSYRKKLIAYEKKADPVCDADTDVIKLLLNRIEIEINLRIINSSTMARFII